MGWSRPYLINHDDFNYHGDDNDEVEHDDDDGDDEF